MNHQPFLNRRTFIRTASIGIGGVGLLGGGIFWYDRRVFFGSDLFHLISPEVKWHSTELLKFLEDLNTNERQALLKAFEKDGDLSPEDFLRELRWTSSSIFTYPFRDKSDFDYHRIVQWTAKNLKIDSSIVESEATFSLEGRMVGALFEDIWDSLTEEQRIELLREIDKDGEIVNKAAIASLGGAGALAALSATVYFTGFAFYTTMSTVIFTTAGFFGVTLPFAAYTGASTALSILSGPVGWALLAITAAAGVAMLGRPNVRKTTAFVIQIHMLKIERIKIAGQQRRFKKYLENRYSSQSA